MHNDESRFTIVRRGMCAYTFEMPEKETDAAFKKAKLIYYIESDECRGVLRKNKDKIDLYIKTGFDIIQPEQTERKSAVYAEGYTKITQTLYKVSEDEYDINTPR